MDGAPHVPPAETTQGNTWCNDRWYNNIRTDRLGWCMDGKEVWEWGRDKASEISTKKESVKQTCAAHEMGIIPPAGTWWFKLSHSIFNTLLRAGLTSTKIDPAPSIILTTYIKSYFHKQPLLNDNMFYLQSLNNMVATGSRPSGEQCAGEDKDAY